jgi:hypothetical protein
MTFDDQLAALRKHCIFQRALVEDNDQRSFEITHVDGQFCCYKLNEWGHLWIGRFPQFAAAGGKNDVVGFDLSHDPGVPAISPITGKSSLEPLCSDVTVGRIQFNPDRRYPKLSACDQG